jgi:hypothetical protein
MATDADPHSARQPAFDGVRRETNAEGLTAVEHAVLTSGEALERPIHASG